MTNMKQVSIGRLVALSWMVALGMIGNPSSAQTRVQNENAASPPRTLTAQTLKTQVSIELNYLISLPPKYESQDQWPLVLFLHGAGERGNKLEKVKVHGPPKLVEQGKDFPFIMVAPQCQAGRFWEPIRLTALLDEIESKYKVDKNRVYVTGLSMGGFGTWALAAHSPERFAAIAPICGGGDRFKVPFQLRGRNMGVWVFHGAKDFVVPLKRSQELVDGLKKIGHPVQFTVYPDAGHDSWTTTYKNEQFYKWLLSHRLDKKASSIEYAPEGN